MSQVEVKQNTFDKQILQNLIKIVKSVNFKQPRNQIIQELQQVSPNKYLWAIGSNPAYFVQYQVKSAAILKVRQHILIVWKPKYIEYPSMTVFPEVGQKKINSMKVQIDVTSTTTSYTNGKVLEYLDKFYGTYFYSDPQFETNLVTFCKHFISKISQHSYWHVLLEDTDQIFISQINAADSILKIRISGIKQGYDKTLIMFSFKGQRDTVFNTIKSKWMQLISFVGMILIFCAVVACPSGENATQGICQYRDEMTLGGAGMMLALLGLRYGQKSDKKKNKKQRILGQGQKQS